MKRIFETVYYNPNEDGVKRERTINLGFMKYYSTMFEDGVKDRGLMIGRLSFDYIPGLFEILYKGKIIFHIGKG